MEDAAQVKSALEGIQSKLSAVVAERDEQIKTLGQATTENATKVTQLSEEYKVAYDELVGRVAGVSEDMTELSAKLDSVKTLTPTERKTLGRAFTESDAYVQYKDEGFHQQSRNFEVGGSLGATNTKTTFTGASLGDTAAYMYGVERFAEYVKDPDRTRFVRELLPTFGVSSGAVEFVRETGFTNNAGMVPEYVATDSGNKPESAVAFEIVSVPVRTMAHFIPITRQAVDDVRQLQGYIENRLLHGLRLKEDQQILYGTGTGNEIEGILTNTSIQTYTQLSTETLIDAIRKAITVAYVDEYRPTGVVINHQDWEAIELTKATDEKYIWVNVATDNGDRLWGLPVISTNAISQGTVLLGDFQRGSAIHDRENANLRISDSHADFFTKNLLALLAEERIAQSILRPNAFVDITVYAG